MKVVEAFFRKRDLVLSPMSRTVHGAWIVSPVVRKLPVDSGATERSEAIKASLKCSLAGVPHPTGWNALMQPILECAEVDSWAAFVRGASCVSVELKDDENTIKFIPHRNLGPVDGFEPMPEFAIQVSQKVTPQELSDALDQARQRCG